MEPQLKQMLYTKNDRRWGQKVYLLETFGIHEKIGAGAGCCVQYLSSSALWLHFKLKPGFVFAGLCLL